MSFKSTFKSSKTRSGLIEVNASQDSLSPSLSSPSKDSSHVFEMISELDEVSQASQVFEIEDRLNKTPSLSSEELSLINEINQSIGKFDSINIENCHSGRENVYPNGTRVFESTFKDILNSIKSKADESSIKKSVSPIPLRFQQSSNKKYRTRRNATEDEKCSDIQLNGFNNRL